MVFTVPLCFCPRSLDSAHCVTLLSGHCVTLHDTGSVVSVVSPSPVDVSVLKVVQHTPKPSLCSGQSIDPATQGPAAANHTSLSAPHEDSCWPPPPPPCLASSDPLSCPIIPGCVTTIDLCKGLTGLGLSIVGGCNTALVSVVCMEFRVHLLGYGPMPVIWQVPSLIHGFMVLSAIVLLSCTHQIELSDLRF